MATTAADKPAADSKPKYKIPKTLAGCADRLFAARADRLALQKQVEALEGEESALKEHLINNLPKSSATGVAGKLARVTIEPKIVPQVKDWPKFYAYLVKEYPKNKGIFSLLQKRVGEATISEMWSAGKKIPGVEAFNAIVVRINKVA